MAKKKKPNPSGDDPAKKDELPEWLRTDDWLQVTPTPAQGLPETPSGRIPVGLPPSKDEPLADMIELDDDDSAADVPPSTMLFSDPDDSVLLSDDLLSPGPLSGKLKPSSSSSLRLPKVKPDEPPAAEHAEAEIDLAGFPDVDPATAGPASGVSRGAAAASDSDVGIGKPLAPTQPASGWLSNSGTKLTPPAEPKPPSTPNVAATWADLDVAAAKPAEQHPDSWHPSSGDVGVPSLANIDLPPDEAAGGSDIFSGAKNPGLAAGAGPAEPVRIAKPKAAEPRTDVPPPKAEPRGLPATPSLHLPDLPAEAGKASWHPSSGGVDLPSASNIDLPPDAQEASDVFSGAKNPGLAPTPATPVEPTDPASGWLSGASKAGPGKPPATPAGLIATSADLDLPPIPVGEPDPSDIFSTARPKSPAAKGDSGLFTGAEAPESSYFRDLPPNTAGESSLFADPTAPAEQTGRVSMAPPENVSPVRPGSKTDAVNFALPADDDTSGVEVLDTSGTLDPAEPPAVGPESAVLKANPIIEDDVPEAEAFGDGLDLLDAELIEDEPDAGKPDFNIFPGAAQSDSNLLGDRTFVEADLYEPHPSGVNLADPNALSRDPTADSAQASSIFNKPDAQASAGGQIDLDAIPLMGSSDDGTLPLEADQSAVAGGRLDDPAAGDLEASVFDVTMPKDEGADSGMIDWSTDEAKPTDRLGDASNRQPTMQRTLRTEIPEEDDEAPPVPVTPKPTRKAEPKRPVSRPNIDLGDEPKAKGKGGLLFGALGLLLGAGVGAGAMFLAGGSGGDTGPKADPAAATALADTQAKLTAAEQAAADAKKKADAADAANKVIADKLAAAAPAVEEAKKATATATKLEGDLTELKKASAADLAAAKKKGEDDVAAAKKAAEDDLAAAKKKADDADAAAKKLEEDKTKLLADAKKATDQAADLMTAVTAAKKDAEDKAKELDAAKTAAATAAAKLKAADASLDPVLDKLKAAKLIDDAADREKALAALPEALKKANLITGEGDAAKLAKELTDAREALKKQKDAADQAVATAEKKATDARDAAVKQVADAKEASAKAMADLQKKADAADAKTKEQIESAVAAAKKATDADLKKVLDQIQAYKEQATKAVADAKAEKEAAAKAADARVAELTEQFQRQMAAVKSGAVVPLNDAFAAKAEEASAAFDRGSSAYSAGRYADAEKAFAAAAKADQADARYWYFLGLSKYAQGKAKDAEADFKTGAEWEGRGKPGRRVVATALEGVQGAARLALEAARP